MGAESSSADHLGVSPAPWIPQGQEESRVLLSADGEFSGIGKGPLSFQVPDLSLGSVGISVWTTFPCPS